MAEGMKCYGDYDGSPLYVDMTSNISQNIGYIDTNAVNGSATVPAPPTGKTFFYFIAELDESTEGLGKRCGVDITTGNPNYTITWQYSFPGGWGSYRMNCRIHYGYY